MSHEYTTCEICGKPFTDEEWEERHTDPATGEDCHERCCPMCNPKRKRRHGKDDEMITPEQINEIVYNGLHKTFNDLAVALADAIDNPDLVAAIPSHTFAAENYMRECWAKFLDVQLAGDER